ncbi:MAG TPA: 2-dehydropantoate 2-reductase [Burkholderiales bacterium]|nr:2-dehydropantoate 2-reductase [Burkholderiales bacterium]
MKICVFGAGAVGGHLAAKLAASGHDVSVVARGAHLEAMRDKGITLVHGDDTIRGRVRAAARASGLGLQDFVFVTLKANLLGAFAEQAAAIVGRDTGVVFAQNGIPWWYGIGLSASRPHPPDLSKLDPDGKLKKLLDKGQIIGGVVYSANEVREPGVVVNNVPGNNMLVVGQADDSDSSTIKELRSVLEKADMSSPASREIRQAVWAKIVQSLGTGALCTLTGQTVADVRKNENLRNLAARLSAEGRSIAKAHGIDPEGAPARPGGGQSSGLISHKPSLLQDYERGRPMEIEAQLVAVLDFARAAKVSAPALETVVPLLVFKATAKGLYGD